jgi:hypothetical protein
VTSTPTLLAPAVALAAAALTACAPALEGRFVAPSTGASRASSGTAAERFFPLVDGRLYHYATTRGPGDEGLLVARAHRADGASGELRFPTGARRFRYERDGVVSFSKLGAATYVLKEPLREGTSWVGEHGGTTTITRVDAAVDVPAGHFEGCVTTVEQLEGAGAPRYTTTFCPDTGIVVLEAQGGMVRERATLKSYGEPVSIGRDGQLHTVD